MTEKDGRERVRPPQAGTVEDEGGAGTRDSFLQTFFRRWAQLAEDLLKENERLRQRIAALDEDNAQLRTQLASDAAIRDALLKIEKLEREKHELLSRVTEAAAISTRNVAQYVAVENDLANLANLYVAVDHLHATLDLGRVLTQIRELLEQLVGSRMHAIYYLDASREALVPIAAHGIDRDRLPHVETRVPDDAPPSSTRAIERAYLTGVSVLADDLEETGLDRPAACIPLTLGKRQVGVIVVHALLPQKPALTPLDFELFRMLGAHAATAITGALLWSRAEGGLPVP